VDNFNSKCEESQSLSIRPRRYSEIDPSSVLGIINDALGMYTESPSFLCGDVKCNAIIRVKKGEEKPKFCSKCGTEIDWSDIFVKIMKVCPKCSKEYSESENFCRLDGTKLQEKPVSI
jgi:predicted RNA-binding Zn-ribbon protein involved in translation (DUF1610 family)